MEITSKLKSYSFKVESKSRNRSRNKSIEKQSTLIGSFMHLMMHQKIVVALIRVKNPSCVADLIPTCFKLDEDQIPEDLKLLQIHQKNLVKINVFGLDPIPAVLVIVAEDSQELYAAYKILLDKNNKSERLPQLPQHIKNWFTFEGIKIEKFSAKSLPSISGETYQRISAFIEMKKKDKIQPKISETNPVAVHGGESSKSKVQDSVSTINKDKMFDLDKDESQKAFGEKSLDFKSLYQQANKISYESVRTFALETVKAIEILSKSTNSKSQAEIIPDDHSIVKGDEYKQIRIIPEEDKTHDKHNVTYIEGLLPVNTRDYRQAMKLKTIKPSDDSGPSIILNNLIKYTFPKHWIVNVTLKGSGGRKSILSIWNYRNPLTDPCEGSFENGLGESRLRALIDHVVRKSQKRSYDKVLEKNLITAFSKALHSKRVKYQPKSSQKNSFWDLDSAEEIDVDPNEEVRSTSQIRTRSQSRMESPPVVDVETKFNSSFPFDYSNEEENKIDNVDDNDINYLENDDDSVPDFLSSPKVIEKDSELESRFSTDNLEKNSSTPVKDKIPEKDNTVGQEDSGLPDRSTGTVSDNTPLKRVPEKDHPGLEVKKRKSSSSIDRPPLTQPVPGSSADEATYDDMLNDDLQLEPVVHLDIAPNLNEKVTNFATMQFRPIQDSDQETNSAIQNQDYDSSEPEDLTESEKALWIKMQQRKKQKRQKSQRSISEPSQQE